MVMMVGRDDKWLAGRLEYLWASHFADVQRLTPIKIGFGRRSYRRLGSIILKRGLVNGEIRSYSRITISGLLIDGRVPSVVIDQIIAHELVHYIQGFGSELPRRLRHPHQGGIIVKEFQRRGLWELYRVYQAWMKLEWGEFVRSSAKK